MRSMRVREELEALQRLYPELSGTNLAETADHLDRFLALSVAMYERIVSDPEEHAHFLSLTSPAGRSTMGTTEPEMDISGPLKQS